MLGGISRQWGHKAGILHVVADQGAEKMVQNQRCVQHSKHSPRLLLNYRPVFLHSFLLPSPFFLPSLWPPLLCPCCLFPPSLFLSLPPFFQCWEFNQVLAPSHDRRGLSYRAVLPAPFQYPYLESQDTLLSLSLGCWALVFGHLQLLSGHGHPWPLNEESREGESHTVSLFQDSLGVSQALLKP